MSQAAVIVLPAEKFKMYQAGHRSFDRCPPGLAT